MIKVGSHYPDVFTYLVSALVGEQSYPHVYTHTQFSHVDVLFALLGLPLSPAYTDVYFVWPHG